jgi:hypothetical protein
MLVVRELFVNIHLIFTTFRLLPINQTHQLESVKLAYAEILHACRLYVQSTSIIKLCRQRLPIAKGLCMCKMNIII